MRDKSPGDKSGPASTRVIGVVARSPAEAEQFRPRLLAVLGHEPAPAHSVCAGSLTLAWSHHRSIGSSVTEADVALIDGTVYDWGDIAERGVASAVQGIATAHRRVGVEILDRLRGDFWMVVWHRNEGAGIVACDQLGGRAPYWMRIGGAVSFASELRDLLAIAPRRPEVDPVAMAHWLARTVAPEGRSLYSGLRRLEGGHVLSLGQRGNDGSQRYWAPRFAPAAAASADDHVDRLRDVLVRAVRRRTADSSHVGLLLSGGLDSSVVAALAQDMATGREIDAYSAVFPGQPTVDETEYIDVMCRHLGLRSTRLAVHGGSVVDGALTYLSAWRVPPTSPNLFFWLPLLEQAGRDGVEVLLDGEGGDELFGLSPFLIADRLRDGRVLAAIRLTGRLPGSASSSWEHRWKLIQRFGLKGSLPPGAHRVARALRGPARYTPAWLRPPLARAWFDSEESYAWKALPGPRWWAHLVESVSRGPGPALVYEQSRRRAAMCGIDARHPLVDVDVVDVMLGLPPELGFDHRFNRPMLRAAAAGRVPDAVRLRPTKSNFDAIFHSRLAGPDLAVVNHLLGDRAARVGEFVDLTALRRDLLDPGPPVTRAALQEWALTVWRLVTAELWLRDQDDPNFAQRLGAERANAAAPDGGASPITVFDPRGSRARRHPRQNLD